MKRPIFALALALAILFCAPVSAEDGRKPSSLPTNLEMLEDLARLVVDESAVKIPFEPGETILLRRTGDHAVGWIVENYLAGRLAALGVSVYVAPDAGGETQEGPVSLEPSEEETAKNRVRPGAREAAGTPAGRDTTATFSGHDDESDEWPPKSFTQAAEDSAQGGLNEEDTPTMEGVNAPPGDVETNVEAGQTAGETKRSSFQFKESPVPDLVLEFRVGELDVGYTRRWRKSLFGTAMVERSARAAIFFRLLN